MMPPSYRLTNGYSIPVVSPKTRRANVRRWPSRTPKKLRPKGRQA